MRRLVASAALALVAAAGWGLAPGPARAIVPPASAVIWVDAPSAVTIGTEFAVTARLVTPNGSPIPSRLLTLSIDGVAIRTGGTDANGLTTIKVRAVENNVARQATVTVSYPGSPALLPTATSVGVTLRPATVTITTVPALDGLPLRLGTLQGVTKQGVVRFAVGKLGSYQLVPDLASGATPNVRATFVRWDDEVFTPSRLIQVSGDSSIGLGLSVAYRGSLRFVDASGAAVDPAKITSLTVTSTAGDESTLTSYSDVWWEAGTAVKRATGLTLAPRAWRLLDVIMAGTNVVNRGQQRWEPTAGGTWKVSVLLYHLGVASQDALFGNSVAGSVDLISPDGTIMRGEIGGDRRTVEYRSLPRGTYTIRLHAGGLVAPAPVALSQDQVATIRVITYLDIGVFVGLILLGVAALLWFGRRHQVVGAGRVAGARLAPLAGRLAAVVGAERGTATASAAPVEALAASPVTPSVTLGAKVRRTVGTAAAETKAEPAAARRRAEPAAFRSRTCTTCGNTVVSKARFCRRCGRLLPVT